MRLWEKCRTIVFLITLFSFFEATAHEIGGEIALEAKVIADRNSILLDLTLTNVDKLPFVMFEASLPWIAQESIELIAFIDEEKHRKIDRSRYPDNPGPGVVIIRPGENLKGQIDIGRQFPSLSKVLKKNSVILVLDYTPIKVDGGAGTRVIKSLIVPMLTDTQLR